MSTLKARWIGGIIRQGNQWFALCQASASDTHGTLVPVRTLPRLDLRRASSFVGLSGAQTLTNVQLLDGILSRLNRLSLLSEPGELLSIRRNGYAVTCEPLLAEIDRGPGGYVGPEGVAIIKGDAVPNPFGSEPVAPASEPVQAPAPAPVASPVATPGVVDGAIGQLVQAIVEQVVDAKLGTISPTLDVDAITKIVDDAIQAKVSTPKVTNVIVNGVPVVSASTDLRHSAYENVAKLILAGQATYLFGGAGCGKTTLGHQIAEDLGYEFHAETFHGQSTWAKTFGFRDASGTVRDTPFVQAIQRRSIILCDEFDACPSNVSIGLNSLTANGWVSTDNGVLWKHPECVLLFSGNTTLDGATAQFNSRSTGDLATKDRLFFLPFELDETLETDITRKIAGDIRIADTWLRVVRIARRNVEALGTGGLRSAVTPRASYAGAKLLAQGFDIKFVAEGLLRKGVDARVWDSIRNGIEELRG